VSLPTDPVLPLPVLNVEPWADPVVDELGVDPRAPYVERFWLPVLGPSTVCGLAPADTGQLARFVCVPLTG
jgi:hypothetical protein